MYDIVIIGAGPAGATLARNLDKKYKVLLLDKRNLDDSSFFAREKCCGGLLAPAAQKELSRQGLGIPADLMTGPQTFSVRSVDFTNGLDKFYQRHYINIDREKFDRWMVSLIPDSIDREFRAIYKSYTEKDGFHEVSYESEGNIKKVCCRVLVGTDGAGSMVRAMAFPNRPVPAKYVSIQEHFKTERTLPYYVSIFDDETTDFYSWIIQKNDELLVGSAIPYEDDVGRRYRTLVEKLIQRKYIKGEPIKRTGALVMRPRRIREVFIGNRRIALAGEAAGFISPSSAEGISYALKSGLMLADAVNHSMEGFYRFYRKRTRRLKYNLFYKKLKVHIMYNKFLRKLVMKLGILSMDVTKG